MKDPLKGIVDPKAIAYYQDVIKTIKRHGMKPIISLKNWDIPAILLKKMKAGYPGKLFLYADYVKKALDCFSEEVELWFAFTEPNIPIDNGYIKQIWYPFVHDPKKAYQAHFHKIVATATAVKIAKEYPNAKSVIIEDDYRIDFIHLYSIIHIYPPMLLQRNLLVQSFRISRKRHVSFHRPVLPGP